LAGLYHYKDLSKDPVLVEIATDPALLQFVSNYLNVSEVTLELYAFWTFPLSRQPNEDEYDSAQKFHFDHFARRNLSLFIYLTDCELEHGAHNFIRAHF